MYGPVCTVVWEGWSREAPPIPICANPALAESLGTHSTAGERLVRKHRRQGAGSTPVKVSPKGLPMLRGICDRSLAVPAGGGGKDGRLRLGFGNAGGSCRRILTHSRCGFPAPGDSWFPVCPQYVDDDPKQRDFGGSPRFGRSRRSRPTANPSSWPNSGKPARRKASPSPCCRRKSTKMNGRVKRLQATSRNKFHNVQDTASNVTELSPLIDEYLESRRIGETPPLHMS